ncbi:hypothetical protein ACQPXH_11545 [Nocardia sp. CA-135953]|uniref:hypothetical protein n=1 Tax=Nocardia sp. CA-135953 TaxID=3239978 RepID=UPI003D990CB7
MADTVVWITGATRGLGAGLVRTCPYERARIINASRSPYPSIENVRFDLGDPSSSSAPRWSFEEVLNGFTGKRALVVHNALFDGSTGYAGTLPPPTDTSVLLFDAPPSGALAAASGKAPSSAGRADG